MLAVSKYIREDCYMIVGNKLRSNDYELRSYQLIPLTERLGFLGDYYKLKINVAYDKNVETLNLFAKYLPTTNETTLEIALLSSNKERFIYQTFIPMLKQLGYGDITDFSPECYFARPNDVLVLEDVSILHYTSSDIFTSASYEWLSMASKQLAKFHACSILLEEKMSVIQGETFGLDQEYGAYLKEVNFTEDSSGMVMRHGAKVVTEFFLGSFQKFTRGWSWKFSGKELEMLLAGSMQIWRSRRGLETSYAMETCGEAIF
ncbi:hypothetical protein JTB14_023758 [Gonioctena quinquepunctata]|nr:hypothetical protein JTB14_023758 [Gonioctena quinquepunctata]